MRQLRASAGRRRIEKPHAVTSPDVAQKAMMRTWFGGCLTLVLMALAGAALAGPPRLERDRCVFRAPRGDRLECYTLVLPENRDKPQGSEVRLKVAILKAKRVVDADPLIYLSGGPGDSPLVASSAGADPLSEGDWWNDTAGIRKRRDVIILSQRGAPGSVPSRSDRPGGRRKAQKSPSAASRRRCRRKTARGRHAARQKPASGRCRSSGGRRGRAGNQTGTDDADHLKG